MTANHPVDLAALNINSFAPLVGQKFAIPSQEPGTTYCELTLRSVKPLTNHAQLTREPFSLIFEGPLGKPLAQMCYPMSNDDLGDMDLFIVPIGKKDNAYQYEAIFN